MRKLSFGPRPIIDPFLLHTSYGVRFRLDGLDKVTAGRSSGAVDGGPPGPSDVASVRRIKMAPALRPTLAYFHFRQ